MSVSSLESSASNSRKSISLNNFDLLQQSGRLKNVDQILSDINLTNLEKVAVKRYTQNHNGNMSPAQLKTYIASGVDDAFKQNLETERKQQQDKSKPTQTTKRSVTNSALVALVSKPRTVQVVRRFGLNKQRPV